MSAESNIVIPCSRQRSTMRVASAACVEPQPADPLLPPNVPVPKLSSGTKNPERPSCRCSMYEFLLRMALIETWRDAHPIQPRLRQGHWREYFHLPLVGR